MTHCNVHFLWCFSVRFLTHNLSFSLSPSSFSPILMLCTWFLFCLVKFLTFIESHLCPRSASASSINSPVPTPKVPVRSRSIDRLKSSVSSSDASSPDPTQVCWNSRGIRFVLIRGLEALRMGSWFSRCPVSLHICFRNTVLKLHCSFTVLDHSSILNASCLLLVAPEG